MENKENLTVYDRKWAEKAQLVGDLYQNLKFKRKEAGLRSGNLDFGSLAKNSSQPRRRLQGVNHKKSLSFTKFFKRKHSKRSVISDRDISLFDRSTKVHDIHNE